MCLDIPINPDNIRYSNNYLTPKSVYIVEEGTQLKVYKPDGLKLGEFIGYGKFDSNGHLIVTQEIKYHNR